jgi:branched-chain amino acid aminotransferase
MEFAVTNIGLMPLTGLDTTLFDSDRAIYEVIRIIDGIPLFVEDHFARLCKSAQLKGLNLDLNLSVFRQRIADLTTACNLRIGNVKFTFSSHPEKSYWAFWFIPHHYPEPDDYQNGVVVDLLFAERTDPNAKVIQQEVREKANKMIAEHGLYEVLLVDRLGLITEGSRSNVFFVKNKVFYTAPAAQVLVGITRSKVFDCIKVLGFHIIEQATDSSEINQFDGAFLTGTSPKVLPIHAIANHSFNVGSPVVNQLIESYEEIIGQYILSGKMDLKAN